MKKILIVILTMLLIFSFTSCSENEEDAKENIETVGIVTIDVNPSLEMGYDSQGKISYAKGLNSDGENIIKDMDLVGNDMGDAIRDIMVSFIDQGYFNDSSNLFINIDGSDLYTIKSSISENVNNILLEHDISTVKITIESYEGTEEETSLALNYGVSPLYIHYVNSLIKNTNITLSDVMDLDYKEIEAYVKDVKEKEEKAKTDTEDTKEEGEAYYEETEYTPTIAREDAISIALNSVEGDTKDIQASAYLENYKDGYNFYGDTYAWNVTFTYNMNKYEIRIHPENGNILKVDMVSYITLGDATNLVLADLNITSNDAKDMTCRCEVENEVEIYRIELTYNEKTYVYKYLSDGTLLDKSETEVTEE